MIQVKDADCSELPPSSSPTCRRSSALPVRRRALEIFCVREVEPRIAQAARSSGVRPAMQSTELSLSRLSSPAAVGGTASKAPLANSLRLLVAHVDMVGKVGDNPLDQIANLDLPAPVHHAALHVHLGKRQRWQSDLFVIFQPAASS